MATHTQQYLKAHVFFLLVCCHALSHAGNLYQLAPPASPKVGQVGFQLKWQSQWLHGAQRHLGAYWDASVTSEHTLSHTGHPPIGTGAQDFSLAAMFRYQRDDLTGFYAEAGSGPYLISQTQDHSGRRTGTHFAIGSRAGVGFVWKNGVDLGFKARHVSRGQGRDGSEADSMIGLDLRYRW